MRHGLLWRATLMNACVEIESKTGMIRFDSFLLAHQRVIGTGFMFGHDGENMDN